MDKVTNILSGNNIYISKTCFSCLDGSNAMSDKHTGLQRRIRRFASFSIYVNCRCHWLALCLKHLFELFLWLESLDKLLLGLWNSFDYSRKNHHILKKLQAAYGLKALNLVKAAVTWWLSMPRRCREPYIIIIEALDDIVSEKGNPVLLVHQNIVLERQTVFQITFLGDVLSVTNGLSFLLQSHVKNFASISYIVSSTFQILEDIGNDFNSIHLKSFNNSAEIIEKIESYEKRSIV